jgi:Raf kinase inhibitor-like YbhB/YbcL family protein
MHKFTRVLALCGTLLAGSAAWAADAPISMYATSNAFEDGGIIPLKYTSHGESIQPDFTIHGAPPTAVSFAIIFHDIEVARGGSPEDVLHWIAWNIPSADIPEGSLPDGGVHGANVRGANAYMGPGANNPGKYNHYVFEIYALSENLDLPATASRPELLEAMNGKIVAKTAYVGRFSRALVNE